MANGDVSIEINKDVILPILEAKVKNAMIEAFGETNTVIETVVNKILTSKVDENGNISNYSSSNKYNWVDIVLKKAIEEAAKEVIVEFIAEKRDVLKIEMRRQLQTKRGTSAFVHELLNGVIKSVENSWRFKTEFKFDNTQV